MANAGRIVNDALKSSLLVNLVLIYDVCYRILRIEFINREMPCFPQSA